MTSMQKGRTIGETIRIMSTSSKESDMVTCPAHETETSGLSRDDIKISCQQCVDENCSIFDNFNTDSKKALQSYIIEANLDTNNENIINPIPRDVHFIIVKSGFVRRGAVLTLQECVTSMEAIRSDVQIGITREKAFADPHFGLSKAKRHNVVMARAENAMLGSAQIFLFFLPGSSRCLYMDGELWVPSVF